MTISSDVKKSQLGVHEYNFITGSIFSFLVGDHNFETMHRKPGLQHTHKNEHTLLHV